MKLAIKLFFVTLLVAVHISYAQVTMFLPDSSIKVYAYGQPQSLAWCGGFNSPHFAMADLNHDGLQDLVVFEPDVSLSTFINNGTHGNPHYEYAPQYALNFPPVFNYIYLIDYNCDSVSDLVQQGGSGFSVWRGYYNAKNQLCFTYYKDLLYYDSVFGNFVNAYNGPGNIPGIADVDNDGDIDFVDFDIIGGVMVYYKNMRVEMGLPCDSIVIQRMPYCWGKASESLGHFVLNTCNSGVSSQFNSLCLFDYDMDGDYDILNGNSNYDKMTFLENGRVPYTPNADSIAFQDTAWQSGGTPVYLNMDPAAFSVDIDQDGKKDLLISPTVSSENYHNIWYYKNLSTTNAPHWQYQSDSFLVSQSIDAGTAAKPMLFDYNKDGKPDLFIGSDGYYQKSDGTLRSRISYYVNTSTPGNPSFTLQTTDFDGIGNYMFQGVSLATGDLDNDGIADLVIGHSDGTLSFFKNFSSSDTTTPNWQISQQSLKDVNGNIINVGGYAAPFIYDIDKDGRPDLLIGDLEGYLQYYRNVSTTAGSIVLQLINTRLGNAKADPRNSTFTNSVPFIGKIDNSGTDYLLMGSNSGNIDLFSGVQTGDTLATYVLLDSQYSYIDSLYNEYNHVGSAAIGIYGNLRSAVTVGNITGDTSLYMIVGNIRGGVQLYKRKTSPAAEVPNITNEMSLLVYPNPASKLITFQTNANNFTVRLTDITGRTAVVMQANGMQKVSIDVHGFTPGMYFYDVTTDYGRQSGKIIVGL